MTQRQPRPSVQATPGPARPTRRRRWPAVAAALAGLLLLAAVASAVALGHAPGEVWREVRERSPGELLRHLQRRLQGHDTLQHLAGPVLSRLQARIERPVPPLLQPTLGKGQQPQALPPVRFDSSGRPLALDAASLARPAPGTAASPRVRLADLRVDSVAALVQATRQALPGQVIEIAPGRYRLEQTLQITQPGLAEGPITLRAAQPGTVWLDVAVVQAVNLKAPYWVFENLNWRGTCVGEGHKYCEHAIHVVGAALGTVIVNNRMQDFNAAIKVNGEDGRFPDHGLLQFSTLENTSPRQTRGPVALFDLVGARGWRVADNLIADFVRTGGDRVSYGAFMKGAGSQGVFERNLVLCTRSGISQHGVRVGLSFGGGGTGPEYCRDGRCATEFSQGVMQNNVVAHCNDVGIDVNRAAGIQLLHNTLINTAGIGARGLDSTATVLGNVTDGGIRARGGALLQAQHNLAGADLDDWWQAPDALDLRWRQPLPTAPSVLAQDFCGLPRPQPPALGAAGQPGCAPSSPP